MKSKTNIAEEFVKIVNENVFLREFTFNENEIRGNNKQKVELADNIVWLDEVLLLIQIKWRNPESNGTVDDETKWFRNKVLKKAKTQIKSTIKYFENLVNLEIENGRGFKVDLSQAPISNARKIIIYLSSEELPEKDRFLKFYNSQDVGLIHLLHFEDYRWICQYLITPYEIASFLDFREKMFHGFGETINSIPEQLLLGKFLSGETIDEINPRVIKFLSNFEEDINEFDLSSLLQNFFSKTIKQENITDYIPIVKEIAKLSRFDLKEFKARFVLAVEKSKSEQYTIPYRIVIPRTEIGFIFIPLPRANLNLIDNWRILLENFTVLHKYEQKLEKCIGVIVFRNTDNEEYIEVYWSYIHEKWVKNEEVEKMLAENFPFRPIRKKMGGKYKFKQE